MMTSKTLPIIIVENTNSAMNFEADSNDINVRRSVSRDTTSTPKRRPSRILTFSASRVKPTDSADRFIANRKYLNRDYATFKLGQPPSPNDFDVFDDVFVDSPLASPNLVHEEHRRRMACLSEGASEARVLNFGSTANLASSKGASRSNENFDPTLTFRKHSRNLPKEPEQVLDLPDVDNNFFTNTITWGAKNHVIAALGQSLYVTKCDKTNLADQLTTHKEHPYTAVSCSSDGNLVAAGTEGGDIQVWDIEYKKCVLTIDKHHASNLESDDLNISLQCPLGCVSWKPNSSVFATGCRAGFVNHYDYRNSELIFSNIFHKDGMVCGLNFSPSGNFLASSDTSYWLKVWDWTGKNACFSKKNVHKASCRALEWNPLKTGCLASGGGAGDGYVRVWNVYSGEQIAEANMRAQVCSMAWSPLTSELFVSCSKSNWSRNGKHVVSVLSYPELSFVGNLPGHDGRVLHMGMGPCKTVLFTASADEMLRFWKIAETPATTPVRSTSCTFLSKLR